MGDMRKHPLVGPARGGRGVEGQQAKAPDSVSEGAPALAHLFEKLSRTLGHPAEDLVAVVGVVAVAVPCDGGDDPVVVRVVLLGRAHLALGDEALVLVVAT